MTNPPPAAPPPPGATPAGPEAGAPEIPVRPLAAWALLALAGTLIVFTVISWIFPPYRTDFVDRVDSPQLTSIAVMAAPLLAVLIATKAGPTLPQARLMSLVGMLEYVVALVFGALSFLLTIAARFDVGGRGALYAFGGIIAGFGDIIVDLLSLSLLALAGLWVYQVFQNLGGRLPSVNVRT